MTLSSWITAAVADAEEASRLNTMYHPDPDIVLLMLAVIAAADRWRSQCMAIPHDEWVEGEYATECELIAAIDALAAGTAAR